MEREGWRALLAAGVSDWGGISPLTRDHVNPEARPAPGPRNCTACMVVLLLRCYQPVLLLPHGSHALCLLSALPCRGTGGRRELGLNRMARPAPPAPAPATPGARRVLRRRRCAQAPWPHLEALAAVTASAGKALVPRCAPARARQSLFSSRLSSEHQTRALQMGHSDVAWRSRQPVSARPRVWAVLWTPVRPPQAGRCMGVAA